MAQEEILYWNQVMILESAQEAMNHRGETEREKVDQGIDIQDVHAQTVKKYDRFISHMNAAMSFLKRIGHAPQGVALDLGSGTGVGACMLSNYESIQKIYAVEFSEAFVKMIMPVVFEKFEAKTEKIVRVVGDFNNIELEDNSVGLIFELGSFHHSEDLDMTMKESFRVLEPGGAVIALERAWPDSVSNKELERKLDIELNDRLKAKYNIPLDQSFTRRDFGEHEYTISQWLDYFKRSGLDPAVFYFWHPPRLNSILSRLPTFKFSIWLGSVLYKLGRRRFFAYGHQNARAIIIGVKPKHAQHEK